MESKLKVGFVGLGIMGASMAANVVKAGFSVGVQSGRLRNRSAMGSFAPSPLTTISP